MFGGVITVLCAGTPINQGFSVVNLAIGQLLNFCVGGGVFGRGLLASAFGALLPSASQPAGVSTYLAGRSNLSLA